MKHTHYGSATHATATFLDVLLLGTFWRLAWMTAIRSTSNRWIQGLGKAALIQF